ncbi:unnamed protein product, partial [Meganyctiphanes norvegica]
MDNLKMPKQEMPSQEVNYLGVKIEKRPKEEVLSEYNIFTESGIVQDNAFNPIGSMVVSGKTTIKQELAQTKIDHIELKIKTDAYNSSTKSFASTEFSQLVLHQKSHTDKKAFQCTLCDKLFTQRYNLVRHQQIHTGERPFQCTKCDKSFIQRSNLTVHQLKHTGEKPFQCCKCNKSFTCKAHLLLHQKIHTGEKAFQCTQCDKSFIQRSN